VILAETIFLGGAPVGVARQDTTTRKIAFSPIKGRSRLPARDWKSMDELKVAVLKAYETKGPPESTDEPSYPLDEDFTNHANRMRPD